ncbi:hypothetical protein ABW19_dt0210544 [Dactylella cylindrospora]|nr:hypothetical protein ABW19_dt0210544 [Dactylella cylindrospora]
MAFPGGGFPGMGPFGRPGGSGGGGSTPDFNSLSPEQQQAIMVKQMQAAMESCPIKTVISGGMGFALGGVFGLFMASMSYDTLATPASQKLVDLPFRQQLKIGVKDMGARSWSSAKGFGAVGALFAGTECVIESYRAKHDLTNAALAGCATGGILGATGGPTAAMWGCAGFAAFSTAIEYYLQSD